MKKGYKKYTCILILTLWMFSLSCGKNKTKPNDAKEGFDKTVMLVNYADQLIIPAYEQMLQKIISLQISVNTFINTPNTSHQNDLKNVFKDAFLQVERISVLQFGPAENVSLNSFMNMLPANTTKKIGEGKSDLEIMEDNIASGTWNLVQNSATHQQGFPALDYLLFSNDAVAKFAGSESKNRKKYVQDILERIKQLVNQTLTTWKSTYRAQFISDVKSSSGSPISNLLNQFSYEMDMIKGARIGWPFGTLSGGTQFPQWCEGYYAGISLELAIENMESLKNMFTGGNSGKGISDLLIALGENKLNTEIIAQFTTVIGKLKAIPTPLSASLANNKPAIERALKEIQLLLRLIKTDVVSKLGVQISYIDNDGD